MGGKSKRSKKQFVLEDDGVSFITTMEAVASQLGLKICDEHADQLRVYMVKDQYWADRDCAPAVYVGRYRDCKYRFSQKGRRQATIGGRIRGLLREQKLQHKQIAEPVGMRVDKVSGCIRAIRPWPDGKLAAIAKGLGVPLQLLTDGATPPEQKELPVPPPEATPKPEVNQGPNARDIHRVARILRLAGRSGKGLRSDECLDLLTYIQGQDPLDRIEASLTKKS